MTITKVQRGRGIHILGMYLAPVRVKGGQFTGKQTWIFPEYIGIQVGIMCYAVVTWPIWRTICQGKPFISWQWLPKDPIW